MASLGWVGSGSIRACRRGRPFRVLHAERFGAALITSIEDPGVRSLPLTGAIDQFVDSTDVLAHRDRSRALWS
jgi:hypothetical protein